jgi:hypothetical protein
MNFSASFCPASYRFSNTGETLGKRIFPPLVSELPKLIRR